MTCEHMVALMDSACADGRDLPDEVRQHIAGCQSCAKAWAAATLLDESLAGFELPPFPAGVEGKVAARVSAIVEHDRLAGVQSRRESGVVLLWLLVAVNMLGFSVLGLREFIALATPPVDGAAGMPDILQSIFVAERWHDLTAVAAMPDVLTADFLMPGLVSALCVASLWRLLHRWNL